MHMYLVAYWSEHAVRLVQHNNNVVENQIIPNCMSTSSQHEDIKNHCDSKMEWSLTGREEIEQL